jgi:hypothetical protein
MKNKIRITALAALMMLVSGNCMKDTDDDPVTYSIGQSYGGGIIFYLDDTEQHGLICAPAISRTQSPGRTEEIL